MCSYSYCNSHAVCLWCCGLRQFSIQIFYLMPADRCSRHRHTVTYMIRGTYIVDDVVGARNGSIFTCVKYCCVVSIEWGDERNHK